MREPQVTRLLENFVDSNRNTFIYLTAVGRDGKGTSASQGNFRAEQDPFVAKALQRAFVTCMQSQSRTWSIPQRSAGAGSRQPACVRHRRAVERVGDHFTGMLAAVVSLEPILASLAGSQRARTHGIRRRSLRAHRGPSRHQEFCARRGRRAAIPLVAQVKALPKELRNTETVRFTEQEKGRNVEMVGTYSTFPEVNWAVIAAAQPE